MIDAFRGKTISILGGGPSINDLDIRTLGSDPVIAVNNAGLDVFPDADVLFVMDRRWFDWNRERLHLNRSKYRVIRQFQEPRGWELAWPVIELQHDKFGTLSEDPKKLAGACGGAMALNLAYLMGAARIILHGFDMRPGNYHDDHRVKTPVNKYEADFIPSIEAMAVRLEGKVEVFNATPNSALRCFPLIEKLST
ncbi:hypothetical protein [Henriciella sp.]|uniref:hypothetical protein n=1 Tax=Henriciella sp. TaxID=1968823 RepID=UPI002620179A|nr:hypothetical protein [Henriciella sp.]